MCENKPVKLQITSKDLYSASPTGSGWKWKSSTLYFTVACLEHKQNSVSPVIVPTITPDKYIPLSTPGLVWNFCDSASSSAASQCSLDTDFLLIVFTFNPASTNPNDFAQFVINISGGVVYHAPNSISYPGGKIRLDIQTNNSGNYQYLEVLLTSLDQPGITLYSGSGMEISPIQPNWVIIIISILLVLILLGIILWILIKF